MNKIFTIAMVALLVVFTLGVTLASPNGADTITPGASERAGADSAQSHNAIAGNVTELTITGDSITQTWQGYYGNVSGAIKLEDSSDNVLYNWTLASPQGEIFASRNNSITWTGVQCFNWTDNGTDLEATYNIGVNAGDGVNETFLVYGTNPHADFGVGTTTFNATTACRSADIFDTTGESVDGQFEEVLLSDPEGNPIFTALLEEDQLGFDSTYHDFEMLVLEDGHNGDSSTTQYFFYVELE